MRGVALIIPVITTDHRRLKAHHDVGVVSVILTTVHVLEQASLIQGLSPRSRSTRHLPLILFELVQRHPANSRGHSGKRDVHELGIQADRLKQLGTAIGIHRGDAHLGHDFQEPLVDALAKVFLTHLRVTQQFTPCQQILNHTVGKVRIDGSSAEPQQTGHMMRVSSAAGFDNEVTLGAHPRSNQVMM